MLLDVLVVLLITTPLSPADNRAGSFGTGFSMRFLGSFAYGSREGHLSVSPSAVTWNLSRESFLDNEFGLFLKNHKI